MRIYDCTHDLYQMLTTAKFDTSLTFLEYDKKHQQLIIFKITHGLKLHSSVACTSRIWRHCELSASGRFTLFFMYMFIAVLREHFFSINDSFVAKIRPGNYCSTRWALSKARLSDTTRPLFDKTLLLATVAGIGLLSYCLATLAKEGYATCMVWRPPIKWVALLICVRFTI